VGIDSSDYLGGASVEVDIIPMTLRSIEIYLSLVLGPNLLMVQCMYRDCHSVYNCFQS
jgi:hypothetical protein